MDEKIYQSLLHKTIEDNYTVPYELCKDMTPSQKLEITMELSDIKRQMIRAVIRHQHPDYTEDMISQAYLTLIMDDKEFVKQAFGGRELEP